MSSDSLSVSVAHPFADAVELAHAEFTMGEAAVATGNAGRARVCGRRAVGAFMQAIAPIAGHAYGTHVMANLRGVQADVSLPDEIRSAASRLLGGARSIAGDMPYSTDPLADARCIIRHFLSAAGTE